MNGTHKPDDAQHPLQLGLGSDTTPQREAAAESADQVATLLTPKTVQLLLNVDRSTVYRMAQDGRLPAIKIGRQWRFPRAEIERALSNHPAATPTRPDLQPTTNHPHLDNAIKQAVTDIASKMIADLADGNACTCSQNPTSDRKEIGPPSTRHRPAESS